MLEFFLALDYFFTDTITKLFPPHIFWDYFFIALSFNWLTVVIAAILFIYFLHTDSKETKKFIIYFSVPFLLASILVNFAIKNIVQRDRPYITNQVETAYCPDTFSFPSGHATASFAGAAIFSYFDKKRKWLYYSIAGLVGLSRIYLDCHYFFDVVFGAFVGYFISKIALLNLTDNDKI